MKTITRYAAIAAVSFLFFPHHTVAQNTGGFLFAPPRVSVSLKSGYDFPRAQSEIFDYTIGEFTIDRADFGSPYIGGEVAVRGAEHLDIVADFGWTRSRKDTEYRDWEDFDGLPIEQETLFERASIGLGVRFYPLDRGRQVGQFAFVPRTVSPFVGVGGGIVWHEFSQVGDFIDFDTFDVFPDTVSTSSASPVGDVRAGVDVNLTPLVFVTGEFRYRFGSGPTGDDYVGFDDTDLSGFLTLFGIGVRF